MPKVIPINTNIYNIYRLTTKSFLAVLLSLFIPASFAGLFVSSAHAENVRYDVNVNSSLTLGFSANTVSLNLNPGSKTFASQDITTTVSTNNQYGYDLYVTSNGTDLINQTDNTYTIPTLPSKEGGYDTDSFLADKWGVMMNNTSYEPFISGTTISQSNTATNADNTILTFGAKTSYNTAPGNYKLALNFQLVARVATNDLTFTFAGSGVESVKVCKVAGDCTGDNLVGIVTTSGSSVPGLEDGSTYYLYPTFTSGYEFVSWTKTSTAGTISDTTALNPTFTMTDEPASVTVTGKSSMLAMQDFTTSDASAMAEGDTITLVDNRDGQNYTVTKINGNVWMTRNLAIGCNGSGSNYGSSMSSKQLTSTDSNVSLSWSTPTASLDAADGTSGCTTSDTSGCDDYTNPRMKCNSTYGAWYNYAAATAGTITGDSNDTDATKDICPAGWILPTNSEQSGITGSSSAFSPVTGGRYGVGTNIDDAGGRGYWWSATADGTTERYYVYWNGSSLRLITSSYFNRSRGLYVRCVRSS